MDGLACALHLAGAGREVTVVESTTAPGGELGRLELGGYRLDTGPAWLTAPDVLAEAFAAVGEHLADWIELVRLEPAYRVFFPDGATLDVSTDPERMEQSVAGLCGPKVAASYRQYAAGRSTMPFLRDGRTSVVCEAWKAGLAPTLTADLYFAMGGMHAVPTALADAAVKHGVTFRYATRVTRVESQAVYTAEGERIAADAIVVSANPGPQRTGASRVVVHVGAHAGYSKIVHHNLHLGRDWSRAWDEVTDRGELMSDPSLLVSHPTWTDKAAAPPGRDTYSVQVPVPNLRVAPVSWSDGMARRYAAELMAVLERRGYLDLGLHLEVSHVQTPATFAGFGSLSPGSLPSTVVSTRLAVGVPMHLHSGRLAALRVLA